MEVTNCEINEYCSNFNNISYIETSAKNNLNIEKMFIDISIKELFELADRHLNWMSELLPALKVNKDRMKYMAGAYWAQATDVAAALVKENNIPWRTAHQIVGILVRFSYERNIKPQDVTPELIKEAAIEYMGKSVDISNGQSVVSCGRLWSRCTQEFLFKNIN